MEAAERGDLEFQDKDSLHSLDVCVLIPSYNNPEGLAKSLRSIAYLPGKLCVLVVDDGSALPVTKQLIRANLSASYPFHLLRLPQNAGITQALNAGLRWIQDNLTARYIARLDCGDVCHKDRFLQQVRFLDQHPAVGLLGTWCTFQSPDGEVNYSYTTPTAHDAIIREMHSRNVFIHPTVMFRSELVAVIGSYPSTFPHVEDYALFYQMLHRMQGAILNKFLVTCEINANGISMANRAAQLKGRYQVVSAFGNSPWLKRRGLLKLSLLQMVPYSLVLHLKSRRRSN
ncbi:glycosyltransferase [Rufibacter soli]